MAQNQIRGSGRSAGSLVTALEGIARQHWRPRADATLIVRGGGSAAAIATIETRAVAEAVARMPMPVVLGIGHAADRGILAEIAWQACSTPTSAATAVRDLIVGAAIAARNHACSIAALCRQRIAAQEMACRTAANTIRRTTYRTLGEQTTQLASRDHDLDTVVARVDERLCGFDADIARMVGDLRAHADGATGVFSRHLKELDRTMQVIREQGAIQLLTAERDVARYAAELAQARLSRAQLPVPHVFPAEDVPIIVKALDGEIVTSAYRARDRPLTLQFHDGQIPVWLHPAATIQPIVESSVTAS
nr:exodeoxyribonuclease VII large subunit [Pseudochelatococcus contaminans]